MNIDINYQTETRINQDAEKLLAPALTKALTALTAEVSTAEQASQDLLTEVNDAFNND